MQKNMHETFVAPAPRKILRAASGSHSCTLWTLFSNSTAENHGEGTEFHRENLCGSLWKNSGYLCGKKF